jgi:hypothetical protein
MEIIVGLYFIIGLLIIILHSSMYCLRDKVAFCTDLVKTVCFWPIIIMHSFAARRIK